MADIQHINADMSLRVVGETGSMDWQASPGSSPPGPAVWRKRLYLDGPAEAGRVTSVVRYDPGSEFPAHDHPGGEEIFVLDGVFSDEHGDYPAGTYLLNPEGFRHSPFSKDGCTLFVKLRQYAGNDRPRIQVDTNVGDWQHRRKGGTAEMLLYQQGGYDGRTALIRFDPGAQAPRHAHPWGEEVLILQGTLEDESGVYPPGTWIRSPAGSEHAPFSREGCTLFLKTGSLVQPE